MGFFSSPHFQAVNYANVPAHDPSGKLGLRYRQDYLDSMGLSEPDMEVEVVDEITEAHKKIKNKVFIQLKTQDGKQWLDSCFDGKVEKMGDVNEQLEQILQIKKPLKKQDLQKHKAFFSSSFLEEKQNLFSLTKQMSILKKYHIQPQGLNKAISQFISNVLPDTYEVLLKIRPAYKKAIAKKDQQTLFLLEQVMGRLAYLISGIPSRRPTIYKIEEVYSLPPTKLEEGVVYLYKDLYSIKGMIAGMEQPRELCSGYHLPQIATLTEEDKQSFFSQLPFHVHHQQGFHANNEAYQQAELLYAKAMANYTDNLNEMGRLSEVLSKLDELQTIGQALMIIGTLTVVTFVLLASVPSFASVFAAALNSTALMGLASGIGTGFGLTAGSSAAVAAGGAVMGSTLGLGIGFGGWLTWFNSNELGLTKSIRQVSTTTTSEIKKFAPNNSSTNSKNTAEWPTQNIVNQIISELPMEFCEDSVHSLLTASLQRQLQHLTFKQLIEQIELAKKRYEANQKGNSLEKSYANDVYIEDLLRLTGLVYATVTVADNDPCFTVNQKRWTIPAQPANGSQPSTSFLEILSRKDAKKRWILIDSKTPYADLKISGNASNADIVKAYKTLKMAHHPDFAKTSTSKTTEWNDAKKPGMFPPQKTADEQQPANKASSFMKR